MWVIGLLFRLDADGLSVPVLLRSLALVAGCVFEWPSWCFKGVGSIIGIVHILGSHCNPSSSYLRLVLLRNPSSFLLQQICGLRIAFNGLIVLVLPLIALIGSGKKWSMHRLLITLISIGSTHRSRLLVFLLVLNGHTKPH